MRDFNSILVSVEWHYFSYCIRDEFAQAINWDTVTWNSSLIVEVKRGVKKIRLDVVRESCSVWTNRSYRMIQNEGNYLRE